MKPIEDAFNLLKNLLNTLHDPDDSNRIAETIPQVINLLWRLGF